MLYSCIKMIRTKQSLNTNVYPWAVSSRKVWEEEDIKEPTMSFACLKSILARSIQYVCKSGAQLRFAHTDVSYSKVVSNT